MTHEDERQISDDSDTLMRSLAELKNLEAKKRAEEISTQRFHEMAEQVEEQARKVFEVASVASIHGEQTGEPAGHTIEDIPPTTDSNPRTSPRPPRDDDPGEPASI